MTRTRVMQRDAARSLPQTIGLLLTGLGATIRYVDAHRNGLLGRAVRLVVKPKPRQRVSNGVTLAIGILAGMGLVGLALSPGKLRRL